MHKNSRIITAAFSHLYTLFLTKKQEKKSCIVMRTQVLCAADLGFHAKAVLLTSINTASPSQFPSGF